MTKLIAIIYAVCRIGVAWAEKKKPSDLEKQKLAFGKRHEEIENEIKKLTQNQLDAIDAGMADLVNNLDERMSKLEAEDTANGYQLALAVYYSRRDNS